MATLIGFQAGQLPARATQSFALGRQPVVARIAGGSSRALFVFGSSVFDASLSHDPDSCSYTLDAAAGVQTCNKEAALGADRSLYFTWACSLEGSPCTLAEDGSIADFGSASFAVLDMAVLSLQVPAPSEVVMSVSVSRVKDSSDVSTASVAVAVSQTPTIDVQITPLYETAERSGYTAAIPAAEKDSAVYSWSLVGGINSESDSISMTEAPTNFLAGNTGASFVVKFDSAAAAVLLCAPGAAYKVNLMVITASSWGQAALALVLPHPPSGGACSG